MYTHIYLLYIHNIIHNVYFEFVSLVFFVLFYFSTHIYKYKSIFKKNAQHTRYTYIHIHISIFKNTDETQNNKKNTKQNIDTHIYIYACVCTNMQHITEHIYTCM